MDLDEIIIEIFKNIKHVKQLENNLNILAMNGDTKSIINNKKKSKFINGFLNPYLNAFRYRQTYNSLANFIESGTEYNNYCDYDIIEKHFKNEYIKKWTNEFIIKNLLDYDQLLLVNNMTISYIKNLNSEITTTLEIQSEIYNY